MKDEDVLLDKVVKKTNVNKGEILKLANDLQSKETNKSINSNKVDKLVSMIKSNKIPRDIDKMV